MSTAGDQDAPLGVSLEHRTAVDAQQSRRLRRRSLRLLAELVRPVRGRAMLLSLCVVVAQAAGSLGPLLIATALDHALPAAIDGSLTELVLVILGYLVAAIVEAGLMRIFIVQTSSLTQGVLLSLRRRLFIHTQQLGVSFHEGYTSGRVISRQTNDIDSIRTALDSGLNDLVTAVMRMLFIGVAIFVLDPASGVVAVAALIPAVLLTRWFQGVSTKLYRESSERSARLIVRFVEVLHGIRAVLSFGTERRDAARYTRLSEQYAEANRRQVITMGVFFTLLALISNVAIAALVAVNGMRLMDGTIGVGVLIGAVLYLTQFFQPMEEIGMFANTFQSAAAALEKVSGVLEEQPTVRPAVGRVDGDRAQGRIDFDDVTFSYSGVGAEHTQREPVLAGLDLHIPAGQTVALVGATGAGKSTIVKLLARFYDPGTGAVRLDGRDLREIPDAQLRRDVVMVTQEAFLFSGTIASNIALGRPGASREQIESAADAVGAGPFIRALPAGYDTPISHRGIRLSAGQQQLVSFARALIADPRVLVLDEATSSLDIPGERDIQLALRRLLTDRTAVIIAHRLSTVRDADRVIVLDRGRILEDDAPDRLIAAGGAYADLNRRWQESLQ
ncbi:ABC transporter ATP-binding protein [Pseudoclavibacter sp. 13-3]|uniref:ABC transporter ATP-binding protein n=1 Tax=Pseudoclavibacter sp. 13-3 TaxID=2901228 RepID=UPI001E5BFCEF|nr:ABC transporter ATP-binding protein [Pseudoclavibacter sp. 13-3]MCD7102144.1 ABC transporter ATP-binding protein/permease [Pseudoclavibacter sp. 13-3]